LTLTEAAGPVPIALLAVTEYVAGPTLALEARQVLPVAAEQPVHWYDVGDCVQFAVSVVVAPAYGSGGDALTVHTGAADGGAIQLTETEAAGPKPAALRPFTL
jgi:hypothetical protein